MWPKRQMKMVPCQALRFNPNSRLNWSHDNKSTNGNGSIACLKKPRVNSMVNWDTNTLKTLSFDKSLWQNPKSTYDQLEIRWKKNPFITSSSTILVVKKTTVSPTKKERYKTRQQTGILKHAKKITGSICSRTEIRD